MMTTIAVVVETPKILIVYLSRNLEQEVVEPPPPLVEAMLCDIYIYAYPVKQFLAVMFQSSMSVVSFRAAVGAVATDDV